MSTRMLWELPANAVCIPMCRKFVRMFLEHQDVAEHDVDDTELIVGELCGNVIRHAYDADGGRFIVELNLQDEELELSVSDDGKGFDAAHANGKRTFSESGGIGFFLMRHFTDHVQFGITETNGCAVTATRRLLRRPNPAPGV